MSSECPFYDQVPKGYLDNLAWRDWIEEYGYQSAENAQSVWDWCARDPLFYINSFVYTYDPRLKHPYISFTTFPFQDEFILACNQAIDNGGDLAVKKSREVGVSWCVLTLFDWRYRFKHGQSFLLGSRNEDYVDKTGNPKALFWKLDKIEEKLPSYLTPRFVRNRLHKRNLENESMIDGESTTGDFARGDRRTAIAMDEAASFEVTDGYKTLHSTQAVTNTRIWMSTPQGVGNAFYDIMHDEKMNIQRMSMHWSQDPRKNDGLYTSESGKLEILDEKYEFPKDYKYVLDGMTRSPWYDNECTRTPIPAVIAQELDMCFHGSGDPFFDTAAMRKLADDLGIPPFHIGDLTYDTKFRPKGFDPHPEHSRLKLWTQIDQHGCVPEGQYALGVDVSGGTGASNSCVSVGDIDKREKVAEFVFPGPQFGPEQFADYVNALSYWFKDAEGVPAVIIWEQQGPGVTFCDRLEFLKHPNLWTRPGGAKRGKSDKGWISRTSAKQSLLSEYGRALLSVDYINRSYPAIMECLQFRYLQNGLVGHVKAYSTQQASAARDNHGDIVIADALCWHVIKDYEAPDEDNPKVIPPNCKMARILEWNNEQRRDKEELIWTAD